MSTAAAVPETRGLEGDDAVRALKTWASKQLVRDSFVRFRRADAFSHSRALAFQLVLTLLPALIAVVGLRQGSRPGVVQPGARIDLQGPRARTGGRSPHPDDRVGLGVGGIALFLGLAIAIVSGATAMGQIERGANRIYGVERDRPSVAKYTRATLLALSAGVAMVRAGARRRRVRAWLRARRQRLERRAGDDLVDRPLAARRASLSAPRHCSSRSRRTARSPSRAGSRSAPGLSVLMWFAFTGILAGYLEISKDFGETYGPLAGFIGLMLWALLTALALFAGLAVAAQLEAIRAGEPEPDDGSS